MRLEGDVESGVCAQRAGEDAYRIGLPVDAADDEGEEDVLEGVELTCQAQFRVGIPVLEVVVRTESPLRCRGRGASLRSEGVTTPPL